MSKIYFDEYKYKNTKHRLSIEYFRDCEERLNPWDITNFISRISTYMYKLEIINTVALAINCGIPKKDIFILDKAYKINGKYKNISSIQLNTIDINKMFSIGKPISMEPNNDILELNYLFEILYKTNQILYQFGRKRITMLDRSTAYQTLHREGFFAALEFVVNLSIDKLNDEEQRKSYSKILKTQKNILKKYEKDLANSTLIERLHPKLETNHYVELSPTETDIEKKYYAKFYEYIISLPRPVVGIYYKKEQMCSILCADHFDNTILKNTQIDLKSITQNSPISSLLEGGVSIYTAIKEETRRDELHKLQVRKAELEIEQLEKANALLEHEDTIKQLEIINAALETKLKLDALVESEENLGIKTIANSYAQRHLLEAYRKNQNGYSEVLNANKFIEKSASIIDTKI